MQFNPSKKQVSLPEFPQPNKIIKKQDINYKNGILQQHLSKVQPRVDFSKPYSYSILKNRSNNRQKGSFLDQDLINQKNQIILKKLQDISQKSSQKVVKPIDRTNSSINLQVRQKHIDEQKLLQNHKLQNDNFKFQQRLRQAKSVLNFKKWDIQTQSMFKIRHQKLDPIQNVNHQQSQQPFIHNEMSNIDMHTSNNQTYMKNDLVGRTQLNESSTFQNNLNQQQKQDERILSKPMIVDGRPYYTEIKISKGVFMVELTDMDNNKLFLHLKGKVGRKYYFVECMGNAEIFLRKIKVNHQLGKVEYQENKLTFGNLKPVKPLKITYSSNFLNSKRFPGTATNDNRNASQENLQNKSQHSTKYHSTKIPSTFNFNKSFGKTGQTNQDAQKITIDDQKQNQDESYGDDEFDDNQYDEDKFLNANNKDQEIKQENTNSNSQNHEKQVQFKNDDINQNDQHEGNYSEDDDFKQQNGDGQQIQSAQQNKKDDIQDKNYDNDNNTNNNNGSNINIDNNKNEENYEEEFEYNSDIDDIQDNNNDQIQKDIKNSNQQISENNDQSQNQKINEQQDIEKNDNSQQDDYDQDFEDDNNQNKIQQKQNDNKNIQNNDKDDYQEDFEEEL